ncbi:RHS repeat domain-containing protein [Agrilutibacter solisilvae]|uniref:RHS repeat protein n=1 Tax=Agrilutibacter solisilvae TaxID=2763317 RepID=A0A974XWE4_9GAMM|nr:RHS repeat domain-containing protein [Lysobacter solisilvae]QSX77106.1 RHS repeat protein [Lysobacter solisilvae]
MKYSIARTGLLACVLLASVQAVAIEPFQEYRKRVESSQNIAALKDDLFGESVNLYNGQTSFSNVDINIPGNNALPVELRRRFTIQLLVGSTFDSTLGGAGGWDIDVPYIAGTFGPVSGWSSTRCSGSFAPTVTSGFNLTEIWQGNSIHIPGGTDRTMLGSGVPSAVFTEGPTQEISTSERDAFACTPMKSGLAGEGFIMKTTSGVKYFFDTAVTRFAAKMTRQVGDIFAAQTSRTRVYVLASKVEDRFGNTVQYTYNGNGNPTRIWSSDGREIVLTYGANGEVATATAHGKTWTYTYGTFAGVERLSKVDLPGASTGDWTFSYGGTLWVNDATWDGGSDNQCMEQPPASDADFTLTAKHPSNAVGTFVFSNGRQYRSGVHVSECLQRVTVNQFEANTYYYILNTPYFFDVMSLRSKTISGPAVAAQTWGYNYGGSVQRMWGSRATPAAYPCPSTNTDCDVEKTVTVTNPDLTKTRYRYGFLYALNEGRVLGTETVDAAGVVERSESNQYMAEAEVAGQAFAGTYGASYSGDDPSTARVRPVVKKTIAQDGVTFTSQIDKGCGGAAVYCFDAYARPKQETKSTPQVASKVEGTEYHDDTSDWVLGQIRRRFVNGVEIERTDYDPATNLPIRIYEFNKLKQAFTYNANGTFATMSDGRDGAGMETTVTMSNWKRGTPQTLTYPATPEAPTGSTMSAVVNDDGTIASVTDELQSKTCYDYDEMGRLTEIIYPSETAPNLCDTSKWAMTTLSFVPVATAEYGLPANHWKRTVSTGNAREITYVDGYWRPVVQEKYDAANVAGTRTITVKKYDQGNQLVFDSYPVASIVAYTDALKGTHRTYDVLDRIRTVEQDSELGTARLVTRTDYLDGFKKQVTDPKGNVTTTSYFTMGEPDDSKPARIEHPESALTEILHDDFGRTKQISRGTR